MRVSKRIANAIIVDDKISFNQLIPRPVNMFMFPWEVNFIHDAVALFCDKVIKSERIEQYPIVGEQTEDKPFGDFTFNPRTIENWTDPVAFYDNITTLGDVYEYGRALYENHCKFGAYSWCDWNGYNWGCIKDVVETIKVEPRKDGLVDITIWTLYSPPIKYFEKIVSLFPKEHFECVSDEIVNFYRWSFKNIDGEFISSDIKDCSSDYLPERFGI
jgi:hypothetical protein